MTYNNNNNAYIKPTTNREHDRESQHSANSYSAHDEHLDTFAATAERSPGRIAGRNRETAMFDPKRGTYMPYGGFDSMIDEYYTEGDPSTMQIPAPSVMKRREESSSPHRRAPIMPTSNAMPPMQSLTLDDDYSRLPAPMERQKSGASGASATNSGSVHNSPGRSQIARGVFHTGQQQSQRSQDNLSEPMEERRPAQYYDDEPFYEGRQEAEYDYAPPMMPAVIPQQRRGSNSSQDRPNGYYQHQQQPQRPRYDDGNYDQYNRGPRMQRPPQTRQQRPPDFARQGRPGGGQDYGAYPGGQRNMMQDPRMMPRNPNPDPRSRQGAPRQMRPPNGQYPPEDMRQRRGPPPQDDMRYREDQRPIRQAQRPPNGNAPYPAGPSDNQRPAVIGQQPPIRMRSPQERDPQIQDQQRRPSPNVQAAQQRGPSPNVQAAQQRGPSPQTYVPIQQQQPPQQVNRPPSPQMQRPPQQQAPPAQPVQPSQPNQPSNRPAPTRTHSGRTDDTSDMQMQADTTGPVTQQEIASLRRDATSKGADPKVRLLFVKRLIEASTVLANEGGKADARQTKKNHDDYCREALRHLKQLTAEETADPEALFFLANCYGNGALSLEVDHERAFQLYESAAKLQHPPSAYRTAVCLEIGAGTRQDVQRAVRFYERAAEYGDVAAMYKIGMILLRGLLEQKSNPRAAITWLQKAAEKADVENPHALHELALLYEKGDTVSGIAQNEPFARELFTKSAKLHYAPSQFRLGYAYEYGTLGCAVDPRRSIAWFSRGAERGDAESELSLSGWYLTGSTGILAQNDREAFLWGRKAAEKGLAKAEFAVGYFYESGIGTGIDVDEAIKWYKRAATAGQKKAQERLLALGKKKGR